MNLNARAQRALGVIGVVTAVALSLASCGSATDEGQPRGDDRIVGKSWQVIAIYSDPDTPSTIPQAIATVPQMNFGAETLVGSTGCAQFVADISYTANEDGATADTTSQKADTLHIDKVKIDDNSGACDGALSWANNQMRNLIAEGNEFAMSINPNNQLILTLRTDQVDSPTLRLASL